MPGRCEPLDDAFREIREHAVREIICLAPDDEVARKSPDYAEAQQQGSVPGTVVKFPILDRSIPSQLNDFVAAVRQAASTLRRGANLLIHCGAGIGRTGTFAVCLLGALGLSQQEAESRVRGAGSNTETDMQRDFIRHFYERLRE